MPWYLILAAGLILGALADIAPTHPVTRGARNSAAALAAWGQRPSIAVHVEE